MQWMQFEPQSCLFFSKY